MASELLKVLVYFDLFSYPLTAREVLRYSTIPKSKWLDVVRTLDRLEMDGAVSVYGGFYYLGGKRHSVLERLEGNRRARKRMEKARRYSGLISGFPFVRAVFISGSISKGFGAKDDDIDYFVVTEPGRLWIVRSLMTIYRKLFMFNSGRNITINNIVDSRHLYIKQQNRYTATEIVFLAPVYNQRIYDMFMKENSWIDEYYPNARRIDDICRDNVTFLKKWLEKILAGSPGDRIEALFHRISKHNIRRKFSHFGSEEFNQSFSIERYELRYLPRKNQNLIMSKYEDRIDRYKKKNRHHSLVSAGLV